MASKEIALFVGSSQQIIEKILTQYELYGHQRLIAQMDIGGMPFKKVAENIVRFATEVAPVIRKETRKYFKYKITRDCELFFYTAKGIHSEEGKPYKAAIIACANKILQLI